MKKILLVLVALIGIGFGANAQSCDVGNGSYVSVDVSISSGQIKCEAYCYGESKPSSGTVYVTVYYIDKNGNDDSEMITIRWDGVYSNGRLYIDGGVNHSDTSSWFGKEKNVSRIKDWKVSAGACRFSW